MNRHWYRSTYSWLTILLLPLSWIFRAIVSVRRLLYRKGIKKVVHVNVPVIVVGNITVGGTGKTPFVIWLANFLRAQGYRPGIVSRGYGGKKMRSPHFVEKNADPREVGDESVLLARHADCAVVICVDRVAAAKVLLAQTDCNIVISDDGLQHYRLGRTMEIVIVDGIRRLGNACFLPAGPLREATTRLKEVDFIVVQQQARKGEYQMLLEGHTLISVINHDQKKPLGALSYTKVHGVAGIGNPKRFFATLRAHGVDVIEHEFPDHYSFKENDFNFGDELPVVMTEKDAVKCQSFSNNKLWYLPVTVKIDETLEKNILEKLCNQ